MKQQKSRWLLSAVFLLLATVSVLFLLPFLLRKRLTLGIPNLRTLTSSRLTLSAQPDFTLIRS